MLWVVSLQVLHWSGTYINISGFLKTAPSHSSCVLKWLLTYAGAQCFFKTTTYQRLCGLSFIRDIHHCSRFFLYSSTFFLYIFYVFLSYIDQENLQWPRGFFQQLLDTSLLSEDDRGKISVSMVLCWLLCHTYPFSCNVQEHMPMHLTKFQ